MRGHLTDDRAAAKKPSLLVARKQLLVISVALVIPALLGFAAGWAAGVDGQAYTVLLTCAPIGGVWVGIETPDARRGVAHGLAAGLLVGVGLLAGHAIQAGPEQVQLPPPLLLLTVLALASAGLAAGGGAAHRPLVGPTGRSSRPPAPTGGGETTAERTQMSSSTTGGGTLRPDRPRAGDRFQHGGRRGDGRRPPHGTNPPPR